MAQKPTDLPEWASDPGADVETPPPGKRAEGWTPLEKPPHQWFNWLFRLLYQWAAFLQDYSANHVHDGGASDLSAPKVDLKEHIDWSGAGGAEQGTFEVGTNTAGSHRVSHTAFGSAKFVSDILEGRAQLEAPKVWVKDEIEFYAETDFRSMLSLDLSVPGSPAITMASERDSGGWGPVVAPLRVPLLEADDITVGNLDAALAVTTPVLDADIANASVRVNAPNVPKAMIRYSSAGVVQGSAFGASVKTASGNPDGIYIVEFTNPPADILKANIQLSISEVAGGPASSGGLTVNSVLQDGDLKIITADSTGTPVDAGVSLVAYWS